MCEQRDALVCKVLGRRVYWRNSLYFWRNGECCKI